MRRFEFDDLKKILVACGIDSVSDLEGDIDALSFDDLGFDSIALMEMSSRIEREIGVRIGEEEVTGETTIVELLERHLRPPLGGGMKTQAVSDRPGQEQPAGRSAPVRDETGWIRCERCKALLYGKRLRRNLGVCPHCDWHRPLTAAERIAQLLDPGSVEALDLPVKTGDPLGFVDSRPYPLRISQARSSSGLDEAVVCVRGTIEGRPLIAAVMDFQFLGGSLGSAVGDLIAGSAQAALAARVPLLIVSASGGARMQEGPVALMQLAKTSQALAELDEHGIF